LIFIYPWFTSILEWNWSKISSFSCCFKNCQSKLHQWQMRIWVASSKIEQHSCIHSSTWASKNFCFNFPKPEKHNSSSAILWRLEFDPCNCWNYAMLFVDLVSMSILSFVALIFIKNCES
jgi:hypothetical protein